MLGWIIFRVSVRTFSFSAQLSIKSILKYLFMYQNRKILERFQGAIIGWYGSGFWMPASVNNGTFSCAINISYQFLRNRLYIFEEKKKEKQSWIFIFAVDKEANVMSVHLNKHWFSVMKKPWSPTFLICSNVLIPMEAWSALKCFRRVEYNNM